ncbi:hypothetical protein HYV49_06195 [Candidatus Pacearchaeota archaeon]|nr:hypothetical protein [Candidatus Pacearchaeota archaeon]
MAKGIARSINMFTHPKTEIDIKNVIFYQVDNILTLENPREINIGCFNTHLCYDFRLVEGNEIDVILPNRSQYFDREDLASWIEWFDNKHSADNLSQKIIYIREAGTVEFLHIPTRRLY